MSFLKRHSLHVPNVLMHNERFLVFGVRSAVTHLYVSNVLALDTAHEGGFLACQRQSHVYMCQTFWGTRLMREDFWCAAVSHAFICAKRFGI